MSIKLSKDEKLMKSFEYAAEGYHKRTAKFDTFKSLIVTSKRVIHEEVCTRRSKKMVVRNEMPVTDAKYLSNKIVKLSKPGLLVAAIIFALLAVVAFVLPSPDILPEEIAKQIGTYITMVGAALAVIALSFLMGYFASRKTLIACCISTDHPLYPVMGFASLSGEVNTDEDNKKKKSKKSDKGKTLEIQVDTEVAAQLVDELGAVILDAIAYEPANEEPVVEEAEEAPVAEEEAVEAEEEAPVVEDETAEAEETAETEEPAEEATEEATEENA